MEVLGIGKERRKGGMGREGEKEGKRGRIDESRRVWKSMDRWKGGIGGGPTALVAVERTNFVLIEKSPAPNPIYKPANMAGVGRSPARLLARSLARSLALRRPWVVRAPLLPSPGLPSPSPRLASPRSPRRAALMAGALRALVRPSREEFLKINIRVR